jgi:hypothetical protein
MTARMSAHGLAGGHISSGGAGSGTLPATVKESLGSALSQTMFLPVGFLVAGIVAALLFEAAARNTDTESETVESTLPADAAAS